MQDEQEEAEGGLVYAINSYDVPSFLVKETLGMGFRQTDLVDLKEADSKMLGEGEPKAPTRLSSVSSRDLGDLIDAWTAWSDYVGVAKANLDACVARSENIRKAALADARRRANGPKADRDDWAVLDTAYIDANTDYEKWKSLKGFVAHKLDHAHRTISQISRHITLRSDSADVVRRGSNVQNYKPRRPQPSGTRGQ